jgi:hypothetical protein
LVGDWDGNDTDTPAVFTAGTWTFSNLDTGPSPIDEYHPPEDDVVAYRLTWGSPGDIPLVGDWDRDGLDTIALYRDGTWWLTNRHLRDLHDSELDGSEDFISMFRWGTE